jgi:hypothetical protein
MSEWCAMADRNGGLTQFLAGCRSRFVQRVQILRSAVRFSDLVMAFRLSPVLIWAAVLNYCAAHNN